MRSTKPSIKQLVASRLDSDRFLKELQSCLLWDFDQTFEVLKAQKLLTKTRDLVLLRRKSKDLDDWLKTAPLSGKRKAALRRHMHLCEIFQGAFTEIDRQSTALKVWDIQKDYLTLQILGDVERAREQTNRAMWAIPDRQGNVMASIDDRTAVWTFFRHHCDDALVILRQAAKIAGGSEKRRIDPSEMKDLFQLADLYSSMQLTFDHYSLSGWHAGVAGHAIRFYTPVVNSAEASIWGNSRAESSDWLQSRGVRDEMRALVAFAAQRSASE
jgi:hypothetical protein